jgi:hypothetical protein
MKRILAALAVSALLVSGISPAQAVEYRLPTWAAETGAPAGFTWGNWLACRSDYQMTDCIESVNWLKEDGSKVTGTWAAKEGFTFEKFNQTWAVQSDGQSAQYFKEPVHQMGHFTFEGLVTPCKDNAIVVDARPTRYGFQVNAAPTCDAFYRSKFEERFDISVRSKNLKGYVGGVSSNGKNPELAFTESGSEQTLTMKLNFAYIAWNNSSVPGEFINVCDKNEYKASEAGWGLWSTIFWVKQMSDPLLAVNPGDMIAGTNGWNCGGNMYWDANEVALVMSVGAPHYDLDGSVIQGWYEGAIRGRYITARFGIKPQLAAGSARLEVVYTSGEIKVATITAKYDAASDWLYLNGYGFSYSAPKLMVKFAKPVEEIASITEITPAKVLPKKKTITCVKGKTVKKVTALKPACPTGYKKKA